MPAVDVRRHPKRGLMSERVRPDRRIIAERRWTEQRSARPVAEPQDVFPAIGPISRSRHAAPAPPFRPTPPLPFRTHVPHADHPPNEQALAPRAGAQCRRYGTRVRDAGRGNARSSRRSGTGSPAGSGARGAAGRPHRRPPAPQAVDPSAITAQERHPSAPAHRSAGRRSIARRSGRPDRPAGARSGRTGAPDGQALSPERRTSPPLGPPLTGRPECDGADRDGSRRLGPPRAARDGPRLLGPAGRRISWRPRPGGQLSSGGRRGPRRSGHPRR